MTCNARTTSLQPSYPTTTNDAIESDRLDRFNFNGYPTNSFNGLMLREFRRHSSATLNSEYSQTNYHEQLVQLNEILNEALKIEIDFDSIDDTKATKTK
jgi:hypothetical protein